MEYILVLLIIFNKLIPQLPQLLHIFAGAILFWYVAGKRKTLKHIGLLSLILVIYTIVVGLFAATYNTKSSVLFIIYGILNISLMLWIDNNVNKLDIGKMVEFSAIAHGILTMVALVIRTPLLWKSDEYISGTHATRLKLFYSEPAYLAFICGIFLVLAVYEIIAQHSSWKMMVSCLVFMACMLLSYGMGGLVTSIVAISIMLMMHIANSRNRILNDPFMKIRWAVVALIVLVILVMIVTLSPIYGLRVMNLAQGIDSGLSYIIQQPFSRFVNAMHLTNWRGVGIGQLIDTDIGRQLGVIYDFKNSFLKIMTEGGVFGILLICILVFYMISQCLLYGNILSLSLLIYSVLSQFTSGSFDDPMHWVVYGFILYECGKSKEDFRRKVGENAPNNNDNILSKAGYVIFGDSTQNEVTKERIKVCLVGSSGGHLTHLYMLKPFWENKERFWVTFDKEDAKSLLKNERMIPCYYPTNRSIKGLIINTVLACKVLRKERPDIIISTGAAVAVPFFYIGKLFGSKCIYIEVFDRIDKSTLSGKMVYPIADKFIVQWDEMKQVYPNAINLGSIF